MQTSDSVSVKMEKPPGAIVIKEIIDVTATSARVTCSSPDESHDKVTGYRCTIRDKSSGDDDAKTGDSE